jgi:phosphoribosylformylglycinamidine cyclo-ligase
MDYQSSGVDTHAGQRFVDLIKPAVQSTRQPHVLSGLGGFAAMSDLSFLKSYDKPVLLTTTDGVGTKLHLATLFGRHETVGIDLVAMCVNDLLVTGARPLVFLDYVACGKLHPEQMAVVVGGIAEGCRQASCALVGGETAEHPGLLEPEEYDLAGFCAGVAERDLIIDGSRISEGDVIFALPSSGIHSNGVSLIRKIFLKNGTEMPDSVQDQEFLRDQVLLAPTRIYEPFLRPVLEEFARQKSPAIQGMVHITGGGFYENVPRVIPDGLCARIDVKSIPVPPVFERIQKRGGVAVREMYSVFNMGAGMIVIVKKDSAVRFASLLQQTGIEPARCGEVVRGNSKVELSGI